MELQTKYADNLLKLDWNPYSGSSAENLIETICLCL